MKSNHFYTSSDEPTSSQKKKMWNSISKQLPKQKRIKLFHLPSFTLGIAASLLIVVLGALVFHQSVETFIAGNRGQATPFSRNHNSRPVHFNEISDIVEQVEIIDKEIKTLELQLLSNKNDAVIMKMKHRLVKQRQYLIDQLHHVESPSI